MVFVKNEYISILIMRENIKLGLKNLGKYHALYL